MNRSLNQNVTFNGSLQSVGAAPVLQKQNGVTGNVQGKFQAAQNDLSQLPLANSRINGTAVINNKEQIQVNAVSATVPGP